MAASAKVQAGIAIGLAAVLGIGWGVAGMPLRIRWIVARGAPPAPEEISDAAAGDIRILGVAARPTLVDVFRGGGNRARKSWVASVLLRAPFFAQEEIEGALASPDPATARAAAFALMGGEEDRPLPDTSGVQVDMTPAARGGKAPQREPLFAWDPTPAVPVLTAWVADRSDIEARHAARLLGGVPAADPRPVDALLKVVDEVPAILAKDAPPDLRMRKGVVIAALQALLPRAAQDPSIVERVSKDVAWIMDNHESDLNWDILSAALRLVEQSRGRGMPPGLYAVLAEDPNAPVRQRLAGTLEAVPGPEASRILESLTSAREPPVRRSAVLAILKRRDPVLFRLAPRLVEDSYIYIASDALRGLGELWSVEPARCREILPLLVSRLEDPWPGDAPAPGSPLSEFIEGGKVDILEAVILSLHKITRLSPGFDEKKGELNDWKTRAEVCRRLASDPSRRKALVDEWRRTVVPQPPEKRIPALVEMLEAKDEDNVLRAMRELARMTGDRGGFPPAALERTGDDTPARNAVRDWRKTPEYGRALESWKARAK